MYRFFLIGGVRGCTVFTSISTIKERENDTGIYLKTLQFRGNNSKKHIHNENGCTTYSNWCTRSFEEKEYGE